MAAKFPISAILIGVDRLTPTLGKVEGRLQKFGRKAMKVGKNLTLGITAPVIGMAALVLKTAGDFEAAMNNVRAISGASVDEMADLNAEARRLGAAASSAFNAKEVGEGFGFLAQMGQDTQVMLTTIKPTLDLAAGANEDLGETARRAAGTMNGLGLEVSQFEGLANVMSKATDRSGSTLFELTDALKEAGPVSSALNQNWIETIATLGVLADVQFQGSRGGVAFRSAYARLVNPVGETKDALNGLRIAQSELNDETTGSLKSVPDLLDLLEAKGATTQDFFKIFGQEMGGAFLALKEKGTPAIRDLTEELEEAFGAGSAAEKAAIQMEGTKGATKALSSAFGEFQLVLADSGLQEWFLAGAQRLTLWIKALSQTNPGLLKMGVVVALAAAAVGPLLVGLGAMASGMGGVVTVLGFVTPGLGVFATTLWSTVIPAVWGFTTALLANPITWLVVGIAAAVTGLIMLVKHWDTVVNALKSAWNWYTSTWQAAFEWLLAKIPLLSNLIPDWLLNLLTGDSLKFEINQEPELEDATAAGAAGAGALGQESHLLVEVKGPPGTRAETLSNEGGDLDLELGLSLGTTG